LTLEEKYPIADFRLNEWATWLSSDTSKLGFSSCSPEQKSPGGSSICFIPDNDRAEEIERILCELKQECQQSIDWKNLRMDVHKVNWMSAIKQRYLWRQSRKDCARRMSVSESTYDKIIRDALQYFEQRLS